MQNIINHCKIRLIYVEKTFYNIPSLINRTGNLIKLQQTLVLSAYQNCAMHFCED